MTTVAQPAKMIAFTIVWHEGTGEFDNMTFRNWAGAQYAFNRIYRHHAEDGGAGYTKVKINVKWENGAEITDRVDVSDHGGDYCPKRETVGQYLARHNSAMYASNLTDRAALSFEDERPQPPKKTVKSAQIARKAPETTTTPAQPENQPKTAQKRPIISRTFDEIIAMQANTYLLN